MSLRRGMHILLHLRFANLDEKQRGQAQFELDQPHWSDPEPEGPDGDLFVDASEGDAFLAAMNSNLGGME